MFEANVEGSTPYIVSELGVEEVISARIYIRFHFRTADEVGARVGRQVARFVMSHTLRD